MQNIAREGHTTENQTSLENSGATYKCRINKYIRCHLQKTKKQNINSRKVYCYYLAESLRWNRPYHHGTVTSHKNTAVYQNCTNKLTIALKYVFVGRRREWERRRSESDAVPVVAHQRNDAGRGPRQLQERVLQQLRGRGPLRRLSHQHQVQERSQEPTTPAQTTRHRFSRLHTRIAKRGVTIYTHSYWTARYNSIHWTTPITLGN